MDFCVHVYLYMGQYMYIHMCVCVHPRCSSCRRMGCYVILHGHQHVISPAYTHNITNMIRWGSTTLTQMQTSILLRGYFLMGLSVDAGMSFTNSEAKDALARQAHRFVCRVSRFWVFRTLPRNTGVGLRSMHGQRRKHIMGFHMGSNLLLRKLSLQRSLRDPCPVSRVGVHVPVQASTSMLYSRLYRQQPLDVTAAA